MIAWHSRDSSQEVDLVGTRNIRNVTFVGSVKWRKQALGQSELADLEAHATTLTTADTPRILIGRGGVTACVASRPNIRA